MRRSPIIYKKSLRFSRWSHNAMAAFLSMNEIVQIASLDVSISQNLAQKDHREPAGLVDSHLHFEKVEVTDLNIDFHAMELATLEQTPSVALSKFSIISPYKGVLFYKSNQLGPFGPFFMSL